MKRLIAGNWKMNGLTASVADAAVLADRLTEQDLAGNEVIIFPPATLLHPVIDRVKASSIGVGGQDCAPHPMGAYTGDIAAEQLADLGAVAVIVGHSERRTHHGEDNAAVARKASAATKAGLMPIICVGETLEERESGSAVEIVSRQLEESLPEDLKAAAIGYEPIWAIGTGRTAGPDDIAEMHTALRRLVGPDIRIVYGGSVKPGNASEILKTDDVDGALVGGACLKPEDFHRIITA